MGKSLIILVTIVNSHFDMSLGAGLVGWVQERFDGQRAPVDEDEDDGLSLLEHLLSEGQLWVGNGTDKMTVIDFSECVCVCLCVRVSVCLCVRRRVWLSGVVTYV